MKDQDPIMIQYKDVVVKYQDQQALKGINLSIPRGKVTVLIGPSGCGKSTTLRSLNRLVPIQSGSIFLQGRPIEEYEKTNLRRGMGYAIQNVGLIPHFTVLENILLVPRLLGWEQERKRARGQELLSLIGLDPAVYGGKFPQELSGGEAQRVGVARALGADPPLLLLDEPFGAVDPLKREELQDEFVRIQRRLKKTVLFVTHDLDEALRLADYLVIMKEGQILQADSPKNILQNPSQNFVSDFLGPDRAIKGLILYTADQVMSPAPQGPVSSWKGPSLSTWLNPEPWKFKEEKRGKDIPKSQLIFPHSSVKEIMARLLTLGLQALPVVNEDGGLMGEVSFQKIGELNHHGDD